MGNPTGESAKAAQAEKERKAQASAQGKSTSSKDFWNEMKQAGLASGGEDSWSRDQVDTAKAIHNKYALSDGGAWNNLQKLQARDNVLAAEERLQELLGAMVEMQAKQAEALAKKLPYQQPMSNASAEYDASQASTAQKQLMKRGLLSLTRWGGGSGSAGGVAGKASNLGATV